MHISQISEERVDKIKNVLKVGQDVTARVIKIDKGERRIGLSIKAASYTDEQLKEEQKMLDALKPGEDLVALQHAFDAADEAKQESNRNNCGIVKFRFIEQAGWKRPACFLFLSRRTGRRVARMRLGRREFVMLPSAICAGNAES